MRSCGERGEKERVDERTNEQAYHTDFGRRLQVILHLGRRGARLVRQGGDGGKRIGREEAKFLGLAPSLSQLFDRPAATRAPALAQARPLA